MKSADRERGSSELTPNIARFLSENSGLATPFVVLVLVLNVVEDVSVYGHVIIWTAQAHLGPDFAGELLVEPGRFLVGDAGVIETEVVLISRRFGDRATRWVYLDVGMFNGLTETLEEAIRYWIATPSDGGPTGLVVLAGPSCDGADVLYEDSGYRLPIDLSIGDRLRLMSTGAYTTSYSSVWFNGFDPLTSY